MHCGVEAPSVQGPVVNWTPSATHGFQHCRMTLLLSITTRAMPLFRILVCLNLDRATPSRSDINQSTKMNPRIDNCQLTFNAQRFATRCVGTVSENHLSCASPQATVEMPHLQHQHKPNKLQRHLREI